MIVFRFSYAPPREDNPSDTRLLISKSCTTLSKNGPNPNPIALVAIIGSNKGTDEIATTPTAVATNKNPATKPADRMPLATDVKKSTIADEANSLLQIPISL